MVKLTEDMAPFWRLLIFFSVLSTVYQLTHATSHPLNRHNISNYAESGAVCNDGSPAIYYLHKRSYRRKWLVYLEGGGGCSDKDGDCLERSRNTPYFTSSNKYPEQITPKTIMADKMFDGYNKAIMVYCSSDLWLGNSSGYDQNTQNAFLFRGDVIFKSVITDLINSGLDSATEVYLIGQSAGGIGVANHLQYLRDLLPSSTSLYTMLDSSWFINYDDYFAQSNSQSFTHTGVSKQESCRDVSWGFPCCLSLPCLISKSYIPQNIPMFLLISKYDVYVLFDRLLHQQNSATSNIFKSKDILVKVHSYGGRMEQTVEQIKARPNIAYVFSSCFQHGYLVSSNLWNFVYNPNFTLTFPSVEFRHVVNESLWNTISVAGHSIREMILDWKTSFSNVNKTSPRQIRHYSDECLHVQCNPTCPKMVYFDDFRSGGEFWQKTVLISIVLFITICCLVTKCYWIVQHQKLQKSQALYLNANYEGGDLFEKVMCLPTCPPHSAIGISCSGLDYDVINAGENGTLLRKKESIATNKIRLRKKSSQVFGKKIIKGITAYFNPGQLVAIMGPSGSGKTTLLDVLTARKHLRDAESNIFINGLPAEETREWFIKNSGYVLQLATPYHEELTVRQNLTYSAMMRLPMKMKIQDKMWRVEQVLGQCGLYDVADVVVGDNSPTGGGLSGGQKRRLCIALQLLDLPSVIFLDEPTSGLDSASSLELLETLHGLTLSGRLVVVTIHQPRIEIFHMFDAILFLCDGQVAYFGSPIMAPHMIAEALTGSDQVFDASNPADSIMDVLTNPTSQKNILDHYLQSGEVQAINRAIERAKRHPQKTLSMKFQRQTSSIQNRLLALDGRSSAAQTVSQMFYFPIIFLLYGLALGTCYFQTNKGVLLMSCYMVFSCASQLFMASVIHAHLNKAFALFALEKADGVSHSTELVLHVFIRTFSKSSIPLFCSCVIIYLCTVRDYVLWKFCLTTLIHLQLNQTWIAIIIFTACSIPRYSSLVTPLLSAVAGFAGGFLVPEPQMPDIYYWMFYINPTHWAYSGMMKALINDVKFECPWDNSPLECQKSTGIVILETFGISERNPYVSMLVLLMMLILFLILSVVMLEIRYSKRKWDKVKKNYWQAFRRFIVTCHRSLMEKRNHKKHLREQEERERLFKLVEQQYRYKSETYDSTQTYAGYEEINGERIRLEVTEDGVVRERAQTMNFEEATEEESSNSSNDEDIDPTVQKESRKSLLLGLRKSGMQQTSFTTLFTKLQTGMTSRSGISIASNDQEEVRLRKKSYNKKRWKINQRRKTFTGFIKEENDEDDDDICVERRRPKSVFIPRRRNPDTDTAMLKLPRARSFIVPNKETPNITPQPSRQNTFSSSVNTVIEHCPEQSTTTVNIIKRPVPPDIVIDIEGKFNNRTQSEINITTANDTTNRKSYPVSQSGSFEKPIPSSVPPSNNGTLRRRKKRKDPKSKDTWSKYLNPSPKRHEVYCALNSVKKRLRGNGRGVRGVLKKSDSVHIQRKASILLLSEKKDSMKTQLFGLRRAYMDVDRSPTSLKKLQLLRAREKFKQHASNKMDEDCNNSNAEDPGRVSFEINESSENAPCQVIPRIPNRRMADKALLERLSALSSQRSSVRSSLANTISSKRSSRNSSRIDSQYNALDDDSFQIQDTQTSAEIYNVLRKIHDSIDSKLEEDDNGNDDLVGKTAENNEQNTNGDLRVENEDDIECDKQDKQRDSDPLLPEERSLIEGLLSKYQHIQQSTASSTPTLDRLPEPQQHEERILFSSKVKIRGSSPRQSRTTSVAYKSPSSALSSSKMENVNEEIREGNFDNSPRQSLNEVFINSEPRRNSHSNVLNKSSMRRSSKSSIDEPESCNRQQKNKKQESDPHKTKATRRPRKISTVKEVAGRFEAMQNHQWRRDEPNVSIIPEQKYYDVSSDSSSSSSEYEEDIVKTHEGFIIPDDTINKLNINKARVAQQLQEEEEEIERQFKKENFLKDLPTKKGIRMPIATTGKVNQLKSKFEGKNLANALVSERLMNSVRRSSNKPSDQHLKQFQKQHQQTTISSNNNNSSSSSSNKQQRTFFRKRRQTSSKSNNDTTSESEMDTTMTSPVCNNSIHCYTDDDSMFILRGSNHQSMDHISLVSSERDMMENTYYRYNNDLIYPVDFEKTFSENDGDGISLYSNASDRKRKSFKGRFHGVKRKLKKTMLYDDDDVFLS